MPKVVIIDNYDSFTYNLAQLVNEITNTTTDIFQNDNFDIQIMEEYTHIILSPGPGIPDEAGKLKEVIRECKSTKKILGVCLGLQAIGEIYGGTLTNLPKVYHGMKMSIHKIDNQDPILSNIPQQFEAGRYHSWVVNTNNFPEDLVISSVDDFGQIMSVYHKTDKVFGVQFHPESIMTPFGKTMLSNFLSL